MAISFLLLSAVLTAQPAEILFRHLRKANGLSDNFISCFFRDSRGKLWIGTMNGLNLYDGEHFYHFKRSRNQQTIVDDVILSLCEDRNGDIWGSTSNGIFRYDIRADTFRNYKTPTTKFAKVIKNILADRHGDIWATGEWNMMRYDRASDAFVDLPPLTTDRDSIPFFAVPRNGVLEEPSGRGIWFATRRGLQYFDRASGRFRKASQPGTTGLFDDHSYSAFYLTPKKQCWVSDRTAGQLVLFDPVHMTRIDSIRLPDSLQHAYVTTVLEDKSNSVWFATWSQGIYQVDRKKGDRLIRIRHEEADPLSIGGEFVWNMMQDADGTLWFGTNNGLSLTNPERSLYSLYDFGKERPELKGVSINAAEEDPVDGHWWIGFSDDHVGNYDPVTGRFLLMDPRKEALKSKGGVFYWPHTFRSYGDTMFACARSGLWHFDRQHNKWVPYTPAIEWPEGFVLHDMVRVNDSLYVFTDNLHLYRWNCRTRKGLYLDPGKDTLPNGQAPFVNYIASTRDGSTWFATGFGWLGRLDVNGRLSYIRMQDKSRLDYNGYYTGLRIDGRDRIWLPNKGAGIDMYDPSDGQVMSFFQGDGLNGDDVSEVIVDGNGLVWSAAYNRFSVFRPGSGYFFNFSLPLDEGLYYYDNYSSRLRNGKIMFTVNEHLLVFTPDRLKGRPENITPQISAVRVNGKDRLVFGDTVLHLLTGENNLSFRFGLLADKGLFPYRYRYRLTGVDDSFLVAGPSAEAVYTNLPPGKYVFRLRAESDNNTWTSPEVSVTVVIRTPFLRSRAFAVLAILALAAGLYLLYRYRIRQKERVLQLENKAQRLEKEKAQVMYENLKQHLNPHFLFNSLTSLGSLIRFDGKLAGDFLDKMSKVYRYVLKNRDNETVPLGEEIRFVQLYNELQRTRFGKGLQIFMRIDEDYHHRKIAPVTLQNLVENAIKHNTADPDAPLVIELFIENDYLVVRNNLQRKEFVETSNKQGLLNMESLYRYLTDRNMVIEEDQQFFTVKIPLI